MNPWPKSFRAPRVLDGVALAAALLLPAATAVAQTPPPAPAPAPAAAPGLAEVPATRELLKSLRAGGYVLYLRHTATDTSKPDAVPRVDLKDCATQRNLSNEGRRQAAEIGRHIRSGGIPVGEVVYSPFCRTRETAQLAFDGTSARLREEVQLAYPSNMTSEEKKPVLKATRQLLSTPVPAGTNRVLVGHTQNVTELIDFFIKPEGAMAIFRPQGAGRFEYVASVGPGAWPALLK